jgi:hypothetical protein
MKEYHSLLAQEVAENSAPPPIYRPSGKDRSAPTLGVQHKPPQGHFGQHMKFTIGRPRIHQAFTSSRCKHLRVSPASKLPDAPGYRLCHARPLGSVLRPKPRNPPLMVLWPNHQTPRTRPGPTTPSVELAKPFTSGARTVYSVLPRSLTWPPPMHRLHVHDFVLLFLHHAART